MPLAAKKIIILGPAYPFRGGIANFTDSLYQELIKNNSVKIISFKRLYPSILFPGKSQFEYKDNKDDNTNRIIDSINPFNWLKVGKLIKKEFPDFIIIMYWLPFFGFCYGVISRYVIKNKHTKTIAICHNIIPHESHFGDRFQTKYLFKQINYFILLSNAVVDDLLSFLFEAKYTILPHPLYSKFGLLVDKNEAKLLLKIIDEKVILFFGFIRDYKGLDILLEAISLLKDKLDVKLLVVGEFYSHKEKYKSLINRLNISEKLLMFTDFIPTSEVKYYFSAADCIIIPYRNATQSGIVQIAMNFRKPVIASNVGGLGEVIKNGETGYIVDKENPAMLAEAILKFYEQEKESIFVSNIEKEVEKYSWAKFTDGIFDLIKT